MIEILRRAGPEAGFVAVCHSDLELGLSSTIPLCSGSNACFTCKDYILSGLKQGVSPDCRIVSKHEP